MKISYNWLKDYLNIDLEPEKLSEILTNIGLEVGGIETYESVKGGLEGLVIARVNACKPHENSDHLSVTSVDLGDGEDTQIVCGAPNVAAGQTVVVATVGTTLYAGDESFKIKKSKIRGEVSLGMICGEVEIGLGSDDSGILVINEELKPGTLAKDYFKVDNDIVFEIDLTPNRIDGASHIGVARDVAAYLKQSGDWEYHMPDTSGFAVDNKELPIPVEVKDAALCPRYAGVSLTKVEVKDSPEWLQHKLKAIGLTPINNVVDVTNFVLHEYGQPLHAFDAAKISGGKVIVQTLPAKTKFTTLDEVERELDADDLMICNAEGGMCMAGVFGGQDSGVSKETTTVFLESAYFNPVSVRKTARRHALNTDASFRFERGVDPNNTIEALKRAAMLLKELANAEVSSDIVDFYPHPLPDFEVNLRLSQVKRLIGESISKEAVVRILEALEIKVVDSNEGELNLLVPAYRVDVQREADVIEEILRIYGYNTVQIPQTVNATLVYSDKPDMQQLRNMVSEQLSAQGFNEMMANSLTKSDYYTESEVFPEAQSVKIFNPLSQDLNVMRQTLLYGGLEAVAFNVNRQNPNLKLYEFGNCYAAGNAAADKVDQKYLQSEKLSLFVTGQRSPESWMQQGAELSFYYLKKVVENVLQRLGLDLLKLKAEFVSNELISEGLELSYNNQSIGQISLIHKSVLKKFGIKQVVFWAELEWNALVKCIRKHKVEFAELAKFPAVRRDLSLLVDEQVKFDQLRQIAFNAEKKLLKEVDLFDVYEGDNLDKGKKSYALSFILQDESKTLKDKQIEKIMHSIVQLYEQNLGAKLR